MCLVTGAPCLARHQPRHRPAAVDHNRLQSSACIARGNCAAAAAAGVPGKEQHARAELMCLVVTKERHSTHQVHCLGVTSNQLTSATLGGNECVNLSAASVPLTLSLTPFLNVYHTVLLLIHLQELMVGALPSLAALPVLQNLSSLHQLSIYGCESLTRNSSPPSLALCCLVNFYCNSHLSVPYTSAGAEAR
jgi:hypothetical protein